MQDVLDSDQRERAPEYTQCGQKAKALNIIHSYNEEKHVLLAQ